MVLSSGCDHVETCVSGTVVTTQESQAGVGPSITIAFITFLLLLGLLSCDFICLFFFLFMTR